MSVTLTMTSCRPEDTQRVAAAVARLLVPGSVVALFGELGSGKTCFVEGACRALGYDRRVRSPSFTLLNIYAGRQRIHHFDLYRWDLATSAAELDEWEERMDEGGISFIEWADRLGAHLPQRAVRVTLRHRDTWDRAIEIAAPEAWLRELESTLPNELREPCNRDRPGH